VFIPVVYTVLDDIKQRIWRVPPVTFEELDRPAEPR